MYELLGGGDVYKRLQKSCVEGVPYTWRQRVSTAFDAACGLSHLHHASPKVFHRDIKSPNILLDRNGTAKMADFGLACCSHTTEHRVQQAPPQPLIPFTLNVAAVAFERFCQRLASCDCCALGELMG